MISKKTKSNLFLLTVCIGAIFFYTYYISQNKGSIKIEKEKAPVINKSNEVEKGITKFTDVEYKTSNVKNKIFITKGKEAFLNKDKPDLIQLNTVHSYTTLSDGTILNIKSDKAQYFKNTKNIKYFQNVKILNKNGIITAEEANFFSEKNLIGLKKNVIFKDTKNTIKGDIAELNTISNNLEIFMNKKQDKVYGKRQ